MQDITVVASLNDTIAQLAKLGIPASLPLSGIQGQTRLTEIRDFGTNPGALRALVRVPEDMPVGAPLVVVLHGCTQSAAKYDAGSGWSALADANGFAVLFPEQRITNNPNLCFNWFVPEHAKRDNGEPLSIRQMIAAVVAQYGIDPARIYVTGLSAGGAMTSILLAAYPDVFAGGAIIAGLPFGAARSMGQAFARMNGRGYSTNADLVASVYEASSHKGPWPTISVWQGSADTTVDPSNAARIVAQWRGVLGIETDQPVSDRIDECTRDRWIDPMGRVLIESWLVPNMGHGTPLKTSGRDGCGHAGPFMVEAGVSSTRHIAQSWGLLGPALTSSAALARETVEAPAPHHRPVQKPVWASTKADKRATGIRATIENALRAAGLMK